MMGSSLNCSPLYQLSMTLPLIFLRQRHYLHNVSLIILVIFFILCFSSSFYNSSYLPIVGIVRDVEAESWLSNFVLLLLVCKHGKIMHAITCNIVPLYTSISLISFSSFLIFSPLVLLVLYHAQCLDINIIH